MTRKHFPTWSHGERALVCRHCGARCPDYGNNIWVFLHWMGDPCGNATTNPPPLGEEERRSEMRFRTRPETPAAKLTKKLA